MKVAITVMEPTINAEVSRRFGRCPFFLIVKTKDLSFEALENPNVDPSVESTGAESAKLMIEKGVQMVLTGSCRPNTQQILSAAGIGAILGCSGMARDVLRRHFRLPKIRCP